MRASRKRHYCAKYASNRGARAIVAHGKIRSRMARTGTWQAKNRKKQT